ncbi:hypothetical protein N0V90_003671 [Kalmusia sp. IMI 367209]|nr:hypothetical protein N0V90_003671 [Kalmusia sp. IMI 367209]
MTPRPTATVRTDLFIRLPRELRDEIYAEVLKVASSMSIISSQVRHIPPVFREDPTLLIEALEVFYKNNTFILDLETILQNPLAESSGSYSQAKQHVRQLIVECSERFSCITDVEEYERTYRASRDRRRWEQLLEVPHIQELIINMQKMHDCSLFTLDFGPVLYALRKRNPGLNVVFNISFDSILEAHWNDPWWQQFNPDPIANQSSNSYESMGYVDVSDLVADHSGEDIAYVEEHLSEYWKDKKMPPAPSIKDGLLSESRANRRALAKYYAVKEPALLRCLMANHSREYQNHQQEESERKQRT